MTLANRVELVPRQSFLVEMLGVTLVALLLRPEVAGILFAQLILLYAFGGYDARQSSSGLRWSSAIIVAALSVATAASAALWGGGRVHLSLIALSPLAHLALVEYLSKGTTPVDLEYPEGAEKEAEELRAFVKLQRYPATIRRSDNTDSWSVRFLEPRLDNLSEARDVRRELDLLRFYRIALRVFPPRFYTPARARRRYGYQIVKWLADVSISLVGILASLPVLIAAGIAILIADGRPIFFTQERVGKDGRPFSLIKLRTLKNAIVAPDQPTAGIDDRQFTLGTLLRRSRIDELPQLINVLRQEMSLVGPRPEMPFYHQRSLHHIPNYLVRTRVLPGLTGWAQVNYSHSTTEAEYYEKTAYDLWYVENRSAWLDGRILLKTIGVVARRFGSK